MDTVLDGSVVRGVWRGIKICHKEAGLDDRLRPTNMVAKECSHGM